MAGETNVLKLPVTRALAPLPGQYFSVSRLSADDFLSHPLYYYQYSAKRLELAGMFPPEWAPGESMFLRGPLGRGFHLPITARRVGLVSSAGDLACLYPLVGLALKQRAAVVCCGPSFSTRLPVEVEFLSLESAEELPVWADYLAVEISLAELQALPQLLKISGSKFDSIPAKIEVLVQTLMPCSGLADCGICAVSMRMGWKLACKDGPVFDFYDLEF